jgi:hypothetical protein
MDLVAGAGDLATLVGLIGQYKSSRDAASGKDFDTFLSWLIESGQLDLKAAIEASHGTMISIKALLNVQRSDFIEGLARIESALAGYASTVEGFGSLVANAKPGLSLSAQGLDFLRFYESSESGALLEHKNMRATMYMSLDGRGSWVPDEPQFIEDDLNLLVGLGLLNISRNSQGSRVFHYTRRAAELIQEHVQDRPE